MTLRVQSLWIDGKRDQAIARVPDEMVLLTNFIGTETMVRTPESFRDAGLIPSALVPVAAT